MSKRLVLVFCALFVLASAVPAFAAVQNIKVSGDILAREVMRNNFDLVKGDGVAGEDEMQLTNSVVRIRVDADLTDNVQTTLRLINERNWGDAQDASDSDIDLDLAYVTLKEFFCSPLTLTIGRQEIHFGNDMIMGDGVGGQTSGVLSGLIGTNQSTNYTEATGLQNRNGDLAYRKAFDALRATLNYDPLVIDVVVAKIDEDTITGGDSTDDVTLYGMNASYKISDKWNTTGESYFWGKVHSSDQGVSRGDQVYTIGGRVSTNPTEKLNVQQEIAGQAGRKDVGTDVLRDRKAWASQTMVNFTPGWKHDPVMGMAYSYFSGDANMFALNPDKAYHQWDPMFENQTSGHIINALFPQSNAHNINLNLTLKPSFLEDVTVRGDWVYLMMAKASVGDTVTVVPSYNDYGSMAFKAGDRELGQEFDVNIVYDYTEDVQFGLLTGWFFAGDAIDESVNSADSAVEAIVSCKVGF